MSDAESVTISLLPVSLSLVHLPRSRLEDFTQHVLRQILQPNPVFLNVTCNEIEVSLFAEHDTLQEFHKAARKDARRMRRQEIRSDSRHSPRRTRRANPDWEPVEVTSERWKVLQIDSHSESIDNSGARVHELSAPLAAAGISILYQSSYMSDFIFAININARTHIDTSSVKEGRLAEVMSLLGSAGFDLYLSDPTNLTAQISTFASPMVSPTSEDDQSISIIDLNTFHAAGRTSLDTDGGIVFTRSRSNTSGTTSSSGSRSRDFLHRTSAGQDDLHDHSAPEAEPTNAPSAPDTRPALNRAMSHSPSACDVRVLAPDITCVGLSDDSAETWGLKIVKLVAFPELILGPSATPVRASDKPARAPRPRTPDMLSALPEEHIHVLSFNEGDVGSGSDTTTRVAPESPKKDPMAGEDPETPSFGYDHDTDTDNSSSEDEGDANTRSRRPRLEKLDTLRTAKPSEKRSPLSSRSHSTSSTSSESAPPPLVPFFSFTRTPEGSSLAAPVSLLATLFPASERHMVMCSQELDVLDSRNASPERWAQEEEESLEEDEDASGALPEPHGMLKCLQIDLRKFGLEKHGLVNRFSRTLEENGINHMYSSTYKTANLLIDKAHANRAQALLRSC
ncbi:hypothetical protein ONZ51_g9142 [Trametes cubensis]|uniref:CASTOR ACT domain-containing protein n=1 Tax=Trametes cubensis TaxID=1111947 RepID=A0AAD7XA43_9APHY|nr:hypothetical protein ONZ51_g9142 [Trametes cubensis]